MTTVIALALFTFLCLLMAPGRAWDNLLFADRNALVFQGRHKDYGAYRLRRGYANHLALAVLLALIAPVGAALLAKAWHTNMPPPAPPSGKTGIDVVIRDVYYPPPPAPPRKVVTPPAAIPDGKPVPPTGPGPVEAANDPVPPAPPITDSTAYATGPAGPGEGGTGDGALEGGPDAGGSGLAWGMAPFREFEVEELPEFPGGEAGLHRWMQRNLQIPDDVAGSAEAFVQFTVMPDGSIRDVATVRGRNAGFNHAVERTVRRMPAWKAARMNGQQVPCRLTLPVRLETR